MKKLNKTEINKFKSNMELFHTKVNDEEYVEDIKQVIIEGIPTKYFISSKTVEIYSQWL